MVLLAVSHLTTAISNHITICHDHWACKGILEHKRNRLLKASVRCCAVIKSQRTLTSKGWDGISPPLSNREASLMTWWRLPEVRKSCVLRMRMRSNVHINKTKITKSRVVVIHLRFTHLRMWVARISHHWVRAARTRNRVLRRDSRWRWWNASITSLRSRHWRSCNA